MGPRAKKDKDLEIHWLLEERTLLVIHFSGFDNLSAYHPKFVKEKNINEKKLVTNDAAYCF